MSILKYFKRDDSKFRPSSSVLPDPTGPLSSSISPGAIDLANERVADVMDASVGSKKGSRGPYQTLTSAQKLLVARRAAEYGTTAAMKFFAKKYPELPKRLKKTSVRRLKNLYQEYLRIKLSVHKYRTYGRNLSWDVPNSFNVSFDCFLNCHGMGVMAIANLSFANQSFTDAWILPNTFILMISTNHTLHRKSHCCHLR